MGTNDHFDIFPVVDLLAFENRDVKKNVGAIHVSGRLSLMQRKVSNVLLMNAYEEMNEKEVHRIPVGDLAELVGFDSNNREFLKNSVKSLMSLVLEWNILDHKSQEKDWEAMPMLSYARIKGGYCSYSYPPALKAKLYNPEIYALISISIQRKFSSGYALTLHENLVRFRKIGSSGWIDLDALKKLLGVENNVYYRDFRRLNSKILKPAVKEVNESSDIQVEPLLQREGRQVTAVKFIITENPQLSLFRDNPQFDRLLDFGLTESQAKDVLTERDEAYVSENLDIVEGLLDAGRIKTTLAAATMDALKKDYRPKRAQREAANAVRKEERKSKQEEVRLRLKEEEHQRALEVEAAARHLDEAIAALTEEARKGLEAEFFMAMEEQTLPGSSVMLDMYRRSGFESMVIQSMFRNFMREKLIKGKE